MKRLLLLSVFLTMALAFGACSSDDSTTTTGTGTGTTGGGGGGSTADTFSLTLNGDTTNYVEDNVDIFIIAFDAGGVTDVSVQDIPNNILFVIQFNGSVPGTFAFDQIGTQAIGVLNDGVDLWSSLFGNLNIFNAGGTGTLVVGNFISTLEQLVSPFTQMTADGSFSIVHD